MTLNETIEKEKRIAVINCDLATSLHTDENIYSREEEICRQKAEYHAQIAEWLKELKKLREIPDKLVPKYRDGIQDEYDRGANEMLEEVIDTVRKYIEEVKADADSD